MARECALQMMYQWEFAREDLDGLVETFWDLHPQPPDVREFAARLFRGTLTHVEAIDELIGRHLRRWRMERMETVDRNVLRLAVQELLYEAETPPAVVIDEAIEVARRYSTAGSPQFINGLLDSIRKEIER